MNMSLTVPSAMRHTGHRPPLPSTLEAEMDTRFLRDRVCGFVDFNSLLACSDQALAHLVGLAD
jgi:hypothetical protein